jgi:hypothetical protein
MTDNEKKRRIQLVCGALIVAAAIIAAFRLRPAPPQLSDSGYYAGPMLNKAGTAYVTEDGRVVPPPPGSPPPRPRTSPFPTGGMARE